MGAGYQSCCQDSTAAVLHNGLNLRNFVGQSPNSVKLIDFACCATSGFSSDTMARQEKQFMASLVVQVSSASYSSQSVSKSLALSVLRLCVAIGYLCLAESVSCCWTAVCFH